jgi:hypothetical protein
MHLKKAENPRVGSSILSLATIQIIGFHLLEFLSYSNLRVVAFMARLHLLSAEDIGTATVWDSLKSHKIR